MKTFTTETDSPQLKREHSHTLIIMALVVSSSVVITHSFGGKILRFFPYMIITLSICTAATNKSPCRRTLHRWLVKCTAVWVGSTGVGSPEGDYYQGFTIRTVCFVIGNRGEMWNRSWIHSSTLCNIYSSIFKFFPKSTYVPLNTRTFRTCVKIVRSDVHIGRKVCAILHRRYLTKFQDPNVSVTTRPALYSSTRFCK